MNFLKKVGLKIKIAAIFIFGILSMVLFFMIRSKMRAKDSLNYELSTLEHELKIAELDRDKDESLNKIEELKEKERIIKKKIKAIENNESEIGDASLEELDDFFKSRGF